MTVYRKIKIAYRNLLVGIFSFGLLLYIQLQLFADVPNYKLALPKSNKDNEGKNRLIFIKNILSEQNFPRLLARWTYMNEAEKANILYLSFIFKNRFSTKMVKKWVMPLVNSYLDRNFVEVFILIFAHKKICSKKLIDILNQFDINPQVSKRYKDTCKGKIKFQKLEK